MALRPSAHPEDPLALECDLQHYLTFPQLCRETITFPRIGHNFFSSLPCLIYLPKLDFCPARYVCIVFSPRRIVIEYQTKPELAGQKNRGLLVIRPAADPDVYILGRRGVLFA